MRPIDLTGQRFGKLIALSLAGRNERGQRLWLCVCDCGNSLARTTSALRAGYVTSCGAHVLPRGNGPTHGMSSSRTYNTWTQMIQRCTNPNAPAWDYYGGRGVTICRQWRESFEAFLADMGERPANLTLDRIDNAAAYEPGNCRWATWSEQMSNRRPYAEWPSTIRRGMSSSDLPSQGPSVGPVPPSPAPCDGTAPRPGSPLEAGEPQTEREGS